MMIISHRGNLEGSSKYENTIGQIDYCLSEGFCVEIDVWKLEGEDFYRFGHDAPILHQGAGLFFLENERLFCHCKNEEAFNSLKDNEKVNRFVHTDESEVSVYRGSKKYITWKHSENRVSSGQKDDIYVFLGDSFDSDLSNFGGICTDFPIALKNFMTKGD